MSQDSTGAKTFPTPYATMTAMNAADATIAAAAAAAGAAADAAMAVAQSAWPVGSVFLATVATNPNTLIGYGTWAALAPIPPFFTWERTA